MGILAFARYRGPAPRDAPVWSSGQRPVMPRRRACPPAGTPNPSAPAAQPRSRCGASSALFLLVGGDRMVTPMSAGAPIAQVPVASVAAAVARMESIEASAGPGDGLGCFDRMYLEVTRDVQSRLGAGFFADPAFMTQLDVTFANLYFDAVDAADDLASVPLAWRPLFEQRAAGHRANPVRAGWDERSYQPRPAARAGQHVQHPCHFPICGYPSGRLPEGGPVAGCRGTVGAAVLRVRS